MGGELSPVWSQWLDERAGDRDQVGVARTDTSRSHLLDLSSNDYLGLAHHPAVRRAASAAAELQGTSASASRVAAGTLPVHRELEQDLCRYTGRSAALVFSSGYTANIGALQSFGGRDCCLISDAHNHASIIDGAKLSGADVQVAGHNDLDDFHRILIEEQESRGRRAIVVVESLYSVLGDEADLSSLAQMCSDFGALLLIDEAHSIAAVDGGSAVARAGLADAEHAVVTATLSKSLASQGGALLFGGEAGPQLRSHVLNTARTFIFDTAPAPAAASAASAALKYADADRLAALKHSTAVLVDELSRNRGLRERVEHGNGPVVSIRMPDPMTAVKAAAAVRKRGISVSVFRPPSVPDGISRLRMTSHAHHSEATLRSAAQIIAECTALEESR